MKRIITLVALSALIVSNVSAASFKQTMQSGYRKAARGIKNHPYISGAAAVAAICAASIASNNYAKKLDREIKEIETKLAHATPAPSLTRKRTVFSALGIVGKGYDALKDRVLNPLLWLILPK